MEAVLLITLIIVLVILVNLKNDLSIKLNNLQQKIDLLSEEVRRKRKEEPIKPEPERIAPIAAKTPTIQYQVPPKPEPEPVKVQPEPIKEEIKKPVEIITHAEVITPPVVPSIVHDTPPAKIRKPGFFEQNPDLEKFIGENLANKIGIGILVLGIGFFVKYAIDQDWINEIGRVCIGITCGGILIGLAHRMRKKFIAFSSVLVGGGIAILYLTIAIAFHEYGIFSQTAAFILMLVITAFTVMLSIGYNRIELAVFAILGGFASPFMVSTGEGNYVVLFSYILILDTGMLVLAYYKKWSLVNIICYLFTVLLFGTWLGAKFDSENLSMLIGALLFATAFYVVFFAMNIINNVRQRTLFQTIDISILLSNTFLFYAAGMFILNNASGEDFRGLFTAILGIFNFIFAYVLYRNTAVDKKLIFLLIGLVLTFISLAAPVQLKGNYITLFWSAETVLLLWLSQKSGIRLMKLGSVIVMALMVISLMMDWEQLYFQLETETVLTILLNKAYVTSLFSLSSIAITLLLLRRESENPDAVKLYKAALLAGGTILLYTAQFLELQYQVQVYVSALEAQHIIIGCYNMLFITALLLIERRLTLPETIRPYWGFWGLLAILAYLFVYHDEVVDARNEYLMATASSTGFAFHYLLVVLLLFIATISLRKILLLTEFNNKTYQAVWWIYIFLFVFISSAELDHTVLLIAYTPDNTITNILSHNHKIGFPILWGVSSFILIAIGLQKKIRHLRIISLTLFLITLLKLFLVDIRGISEGGKIAAFISLGVLLLVVSFMYQRLKKLLLTDESEKQETS
ncbi:MAG: DUF2339 domain-containing protein [Cyclobacteriaceae bacterium]|nr:DUF2339 domain-containing protein [Cyclobacteriaceae bacterium]